MQLPRRARRSRNASAEIPGSRDKTSLPIPNSANGPPADRENSAVVADATVEDVPAGGAVVKHL